MDLSFTPEQNAFREEVREWIQSAMPPELREKADKGAEFEQSETLQWHKILFEKGWIAPGWPEEVGGTGWDVGQRFIFQEECIRANTPQLSPFGLSMVGPLIIQYGDDEQKARRSGARATPSRTRARISRRCSCAPSATATTTC
jgi:alkylation response protein AidB-like acyl-CoA dehydrogenase